jgi:hypothetical protein
VYLLFACADKQAGRVVQTQKQRRQRRPHFLFLHSCSSNYSHLLTHPSFISTALHTFSQKAALNRRSNTSITPTLATSILSKRAATRRSSAPHSSINAHATNPSLLFIFVINRVASAAHTLVIHAFIHRG